MQVTGTLLTKYADDLRIVRDSYFCSVPINVMAILLRNLKSIEQELRVLLETSNFLEQHYSKDSEEYAMQYDALYNSTFNVNFREIPYVLIENEDISPAVIALILPFIGGYYEKDKEGSF